MADAASQQQDAPPERECAVKHSRGVLNAKIFANCFKAILNKTMATYSTDLMDSPLDVTQQKAVFKTVSKAIQREIKAIYDEEDTVAAHWQMCSDSRDIVKSANKKVLRIDRAAPPYYFYSKKFKIPEARWKCFFAQRILIFHNHISQERAKSMPLDGTLAPALCEISFNEKNSIVF